MFAGCEMTPTRNKLRRTKSSFLNATMPWTTDAHVDHPMCISMFATSNIYLRCVVFARRRNWNSQRNKLAGRKVMSNPRSKSYACHHHGVHEYSCSPKTIRWHNMWLLWIWMNKFWVQENNSSPRYPQDRKTTSQRDPLNCGQTPPEHGRTNATTRTCDSTNRINWDLQRNWHHIKHHALPRMFQITCQYNCFQKRAQNHHSERINFTSTSRNKKVDETRMFPLPCPSHRKH